MANTPRKSSRVVKLNRKEGFYYDEESLRPLSQRSLRSSANSDTWQRRTDSESVRSVSESESIVSSENNTVRALSTWSVLEKLALYFNQFTFPYSDKDFNANTSLVFY